MVSMENTPTTTLFSETMSSVINGDVAILEGALLREWTGLVRVEERTNLLRGLLILGLGTNYVENFR